MRTVLPEAPATHYRLSEDSKAKAIAEFLDGRTAKQVGSKWRVSAGTIYRWSQQAGCNKYIEGDLRARANAAAVEAAEEGRRERLYEPTPAAPLVAGVAYGAEDDPRMLASAALRGVAEAMRQERLDEARTLMQLADGLGRIAARSQGVDSSLETVLRALQEPEFRTELFSMIGDMENPVKQAYWAWACGPADQAQARMDAVTNLAHEVAELRGILTAQMGETAAKSAMKAARMETLMMWHQGKPPADVLAELEAKFGPS